MRLIRWSCIWTVIVAVGWSRMLQDQWLLEQTCLEWRPPIDKCSVGRPRAHWTDDLRKMAGGGWMRVVENRDIWRELEEVSNSNPLLYISSSGL
ncbi:unnamed protein product [Euphydryas editha]|uniref:Uncharacterized protein n=1 Tax=Euphydryas editha TaxID=104508 RepID=A0AAU9TU41_EUPED|nr:unnamed protein product [Euphydryas editha]